MKTSFIAYDGSECSEAIFTELQHAGLPPQLTAHVVAVAESWAMLPAVPSAAAENADVMRRAGALAERGAARLRAVFPGWRW